MKKRTPRKIKKSNRKKLDKWLNPTLKDIYKYHKINREARVIEMMDSMIKMLRYAEKDKMESYKPVVGGFDMLNQMLSDGTVKLDTYLKLKECIENPDAIYEIKMINV
jgi:hypothetical protein